MLEYYDVIQLPRVPIDSEETHQHRAAEGHRSQVLRTGLQASHRLKMRISVLLHLVLARTDLMNTSEPPVGASPDGARVLF